MDSVFDQFDEDPSGALVGEVPAVGANIFDSIPDDPVEEARPAAPRASKTEQPEPLPPFPGAIVDDPILHDAFQRLEATHTKRGTDALNKARGDGFIDGLMDSQQYAEGAKGVIPGAIGFGGSVLKGGAGIKAGAESNAAVFAQSQLGVMDRIDKGDLKAANELHPSLLGYGQMSADQRLAARARLERQFPGFTPTPVAEQGLFKAGAAVTKFGKELIPAAPGYEESVGRQLGEGIGSLIGGLPSGFLGRLPATAVFGAAGSGEAAERAIEFDRKERAAGRPGLTQDQINVASLWGIAPGTTDIIPLETLMGRLKIPAPFSRAMARAIGRVGGQAVIEGLQEGGQSYLQNLIAKEIYSPEQKLGEGVLPSSGIGAGVGGISQAAQEMARLLIRSAAGRRGGGAQPAPQPSEPAEDVTPGEVLQQAAPAVPAEGAPQPAQEAPTTTEAVQGDTPAPASTATPPAQDKAVFADVRRWAKETYGPDARVSRMGPQYSIGVETDGVTEFMTPAGGITLEQVQEEFGYRPLAESAPAATPIIEKITRYDEEFGEPILRQAYDRLDAWSKQEVIDRNRRGEDIADLMEEMAMRMEDAPTVAAMAVKRGITRKQQAELREFIQREQPELLASFDEMAKQLPERRPRAGQDVPRAAALRQSFAQMIDDRVPQKDWATQLGVSGEELAPLVEEAIAKNWLRRDKTGRITRAPKTQRSGGLSAMAVPENIPAQIPGEEGDVAYTDAAQARRAELQEAVDMAASRILPTAVRVKVVEKIEIARKAAEAYALRAYHGTPHDFDRFDMSKIGTGEGFQAVGHGLYFAEEEAVARWYQNQLTRWTSAGEALDSDTDELLNFFDGNIQSAIGDMADTVGPDHPKVKALEEIARKGIKKESNFYEVSLEVEKGDLLAWDKPLSQQSDNVKSALKKLGFEAVEFRTGEWLYRELEHRRLDGAEEASNALKEAGIPGIRYLDQDSRADGEGTGDLVIFDDALIKITKKNGEPVTPKERQDAVEQMFALRDSPDQTQTPEFKKWFGESKVVDKSGKPFVVYHGSTANIEAFDPAKRGSMTQAPSAEVGFFFTNRRKTAEYYSIGDSRSADAARKLAADERKNAERMVRLYEQQGDETKAAEWRQKLETAAGPNVQEVYLSLQNPLVHDFKGKIFRDESYRALIDRARAEGHDGVILKNTYDAGEKNRFDALMRGRIRSEDIYVAFEPTQIKSAIGNRGTFDPADPRIAFALRGFYSPAIRAAESISMKKGTGEQFWKQITKTPGVRKDELEWMGLEEFLAGKKSITKDEVLAFMQAHQVELDEKVLGGPRYDEKTIDDAIAHLAKEEGTTPDDVVENFGYSNREDYVFLAKNRGFSAERVAGRARPMFAGHQVPGGENYRELLIRLPELEGGEKSSEWRTLTKQIEAINVQVEADPSRYKALEPEYDRLTARRREIERTPGYESKHFGDQEIVHLRVDDRTGPNGEKVLFINEVQSDLHQVGRHAGYDAKQTAARRAELKQQIADAVAEKDAAVEAKRGPDGRVDTSHPELQPLYRRLAELEASFHGVADPVPNAPFKGDLWLELALKRALLYASENGYDAISWARSDQIAKAVGAEPEKLALQYDSKIGKFLDKYTKKWGAKVEEAAVVETRSNDGTRGNQRDLRNLDGQIAANERALGGELTDTARAQVETQLGLLREQRAALSGKDGEGMNPILRVTPEMRSSVMEGQPLATRRTQTQGEPEALGRTDPYTMTISIAAHAIEAEAAAKGVSPRREAVRVLRHEAVEFFKATGMFTNPEWKLLQETARKQGWVESTGVREAYTQLYKEGMSDQQLEDLLLKEAIAEQYSEFHLGTKQFKGPIRVAFQRIKDFLLRAMNALRGMGFQKWEDVFESIDAGEFKRRFDVQPATAPMAGEQAPRTGAAAIQATAGVLPDSPARQASAGLDQPSQSLSDLVTAFNKALGLTVRQGRLDPGLTQAAGRAGNTVRGQASFDTGIIRLRVSNEIDTLAHEGGHSLETRYGSSLDNVKQRFAAELTPLASPGPDALSEGFAEFFRRYITNPAASRRVAPGFEAAFEIFINSKNPEMLANLQNIRTGYQEWLQAPSGGVVASSIATTIRPGTVQEVRREIDDKGFKNTIKGWADSLYTSVFDDLHPVNKAVEGLLEIAQANVPGGKDIGLKTADNPYKLLRLARDAYAAGHMDLLYGVSGYHDTAAQGPSLREAMASAFGGLASDQWNDARSKQFGAYLTSRRMVQEWARFAAGELDSPPDKFSLADHQQSIKDYEAAHPQFKLAAQQVYSFLSNMLRKKRDAGLITPELYDELVQRQDYVPVLRDMSDRNPDGSVEGMAPSRKDKQSVIKKFRGSQRDVINPLESIAKDAYETAMIIARNDAVKALDALARAAGPDAGKFAERIPAHQMKQSQVNIQESIKAAAASAGIQPGDLQVMIQAVDDKLGDNAIAQIWKAGEVNEKGEPIVYLWEKGKRIPIRLADGKFGQEMLNAVTGLGKEASGWFVNLLSLPSAAVRFGVTASLDFIGANYLRDQVSAWVLMKDFTPFVDGAKGIYNDLSMQEVSRMYSRAGGLFGGANTTSLHESRIKREVLELRRRGIRFTLNPMTRDFWRMTEFSETGTRIAVFEKAFKRSKADGLRDWEAAIEAAFAARDMIDFGRRGSRMLAARRLVPFLNAALQGMDRTVRGLRGKVDDHMVLRTAISPYIKSRTGQPLSIVERRNLKRAAQTWGHMVSLAMVGLGLSFLYKDDEEYEEISDYVRATHWLFRVNGEWVRIPKPFELAVFSNMTERTFEYVYRDDPSAPGRFVDGLHQILIPPHGIPGVQVTTELLTNYSFFADRPIVGAELQGLPPEMQFNAYASEFGKYLGKQVGTSPAYIDHFVTGFGASWGREFLNTSNAVLPRVGRATGGALGLPTASAADTAPHDYFFARRFMTHETRGSTSTREFWSLVGMDNGKFTEAANGYKHLVERVRDSLGAQEFLEGLSEEERAYALLEAGQTERKSKMKLLHPLNRAKEINSVASGIRREMNMDRLYAGKKEDAEKITVPPSTMRMVDDTLAQISMREARNALIALGADGWKQKKIMPVEHLYGELAAAAPEVHELMLDRLKKKRLPSFADVRSGWPEAKQRILEDGQDALLRDLYMREIPTWGQQGIGLQ